MNAEKRLGMIREALKTHQADIHLLPLHRQVIPWAARSNVDLPHRADNQVWPIWAKVKDNAKAP